MANHIIQGIVTEPNGDKIALKKVKVRPTTPAVMTYWPSWRYHPDTGEGEIFESEDQVPEGWLEHPPTVSELPVFTSAAFDPATGEGDGDEEDESEAEEDGDEDEGEEGCGEELPAIEDITLDGIRKALKDREIPFVQSAKKDALYELLSENWN